MNQWVTPEIDIVFVVGSFGASGEPATPWAREQGRPGPCWLRASTCWPVHLPAFRLASVDVSIT